MLLTRTVICSLKMGRFPHRPPRRCRSGGGRAWGGPGSEPPLSPSRLALVTRPLTPRVTPGMPGTAWGPVVRQLQSAPLLLRDRALWPSNRCTQLHLASSPCANRGPSRGIYCRENMQALSACGRQSHPTPCPRALPLSLEKLRSSSLGVLATVRSNLRPSSTGPPGNRGQGLEAGAHRTHPVPAPLAMSWV